MGRVMTAFCPLCESEDTISRTYTHDVVHECLNCEHQWTTLLAAPDGSRNEQAAR